MKIKDIIEQLWLDCNNIPDDGTIYDPIGKLQDQAVEAVKDRVKGQLLAREEIEKILNDDKYDQQAERAGCIDIELSNKNKAKAIKSEMDKAVEVL